MSNPLIEQQVPAALPVDQGVKSGTNLLMPPITIEERLRHFPEEVYDLTPSSHLRRLLNVLLGDAGLGQLRKQYLAARLQSTLHGTHFFDLDRFYGALFGIGRRGSEDLTLNPYTDVATNQEWEDIEARDGSYRSRVEQFARALQFGATAIGMELVAEAMLGVDVEVEESFVRADKVSQSYGDLELLGDYEDLEAYTYGGLEANAPGNNPNFNRWTFTIIPKRPTTAEERYDLLKVLGRIKPAHALMYIRDAEADSLDEVAIRDVSSDSEYWEVRQRVVARAGVEDAYPTSSSAADPAERRRPPFSAYQGEEWSYMGDVAGVMAYALWEGGGIETKYYERIDWNDVEYTEYLPSKGVRPIQEVLAGRIADGVLVSHFFSTNRGDANTFDVQSITGQVRPIDIVSIAALAPTYVDGLSLDDVLKVSSARLGLLRKQVETSDRYWSTPAHPIADPRQEVLEVRLRTEQRVNYVHYELPHFPLLAEFQYFDESTSTWVTDHTFSVTDSFPNAIVQRNDPSFRFHPQHGLNGHWIPVDRRLNPVRAKSFRVVMHRLATGSAPVNSSGNAVPYSLGLKSFDLGYRITAREDIPLIPNSESQDIGGSIDILGSRVSFDLREKRARGLLESPQTEWLSEPQPVGSAVVNFYVDVRGPEGQAQVIDRFWLDPVKPGPRLNLYYTDSLPTGRYTARDTLLGPAEVARTGLIDSSASGLDFSGSDPAFVDVDNSYLQWNPAETWWMGMVLYPSNPSTGGIDVDGLEILDENDEEILDEEDAPLTDENVGLTDPTETVPIVSWDNFQLNYTLNSLQFVTRWGQVVELAVPWTTGSRVTVVLSYNAITRQVRLWVRNSLGEDYELTLTLTQTIVTKPAALRIGSDPTGERIGAFRLGNFVLKTHAPVNPEDYADHSRDYAVKAEYYQYDTQRTENALLRYHPLHRTESRLGFVGGPGDFYEFMTWTPVPRDYTLQKGYVATPPIAARFWKFEFTNLVAQPYEVFAPIEREIKLFPRKALPDVDTYDNFGAYEKWPGVSTSLNSSIPYFDTPVTDDTPESFNYAPTEVYYPGDAMGPQRLRALGWAYGFISWHIGRENPRFKETGVHSYERIVVSHTQKVAFFVGLKDLIAYNSRPASSDNPQAIIERFWNNRNIASGSTWSLNPGRLSAFNSNAVARSVQYLSRNNVRGLQFATQQSEAVQLIPDDSFQDPHLMSSTWTNPDEWHAYGDAVLQYLPSDSAVLVARQSAGSGEVALGNDYGIDQPLPHPAFSIFDEAGYVPDADGGIESTIVPVSAEGVIHAAARITALTDIINPLTLQIVSLDGTVLEESEITARAGETIEWTCSYILGSYQDASLPTFDRRTIIDHPVHLVFAREDELVDLDPSEPVGQLFKVRLVQGGASSDVYKVDRLSLFDESMLWEFSVDGGGTWTPAYGIRNNPYGVLTFPEPGTSLVWRVRAFRTNMHVSALQIRPWYADLVTQRLALPQRGPNVSAFDQFPPIVEDPEFQRWFHPVPYWWWLEGQQFAALPIEGMIVPNDFNRGYIRVAQTDVSVTDEVARTLFMRRYATEDPEDPEANATDVSVSDVATRSMTMSRSVATDVSVDSSTVYGNVLPSHGTLPHLAVHPFRRDPIIETWDDMEAGDVPTDPSADLAWFRWTPTDSEQPESDGAGLMVYDGANYADGDGVNRYLHTTPMSSVDGAVWMQVADWSAEYVTNTIMLGMRAPHPDVTGGPITPTVSASLDLLAGELTLTDGTNSDVVDVSAYVPEGAFEFRMTIEGPIAQALIDGDVYASLTIDANAPVPPPEYPNLYNMFGINLVTATGPPAQSSVSITSWGFEPLPIDNLIEDADFEDGPGILWGDDEDEVPPDEGGVA